MRLETVKVVNPNDPKGGYMLVNKTDWEANKKSDTNADGFELHETDPAHPEVSEEDKEQARLDQEAADAPKPKNSDGTFDEPTPLDIRYPDKDATEFARNHGAQIGTSAAELRDVMELEQKPGGLDPSQKEAVDAEEDARKRRETAAEAAKQEKGKITRRLPQVAVNRGAKNGKRTTGK